MAYGNGQSAMRSVQTGYNDMLQTYTAEGMQIEFVGVHNINEGSAIVLGDGDFDIRSSGLYDIRCTVVSTPSAAGTQTIQFYDNGVALPQAIESETTVADSILTQHLETTLNLKCCCAVDHVITARISGVAGTISHVQVSCIKVVR